MGRGDKKTKKGKQFMGSYGVSRPKAANKTKYVAKATETVQPAAKVAKAPKAKAAAKA
jgi:ribosomal small subunit protein bTHX